MAGGGAIGGFSSRRKSLDAELNLVPFIDLLSVCISFLLMTAVWLQIGSLQVKQSHGTEGADVSKSQYEIELKYVEPTQIKVDFKSKGRLIKSLPVKAADSKALAAELDQSLTKTLDSLSGGGKVKVKDLIATAMITPKKGVNYGNMVSIMDVLRHHEIKNLGIVPVKD